jgi:uncharacterized protein YfaS (alpha-2-macroglobulin family)
MHRNMWYAAAVILIISALIGVTQFNSCVLTDDSQAQTRNISLPQDLQVISATPAGLVQDPDQFYSVVVVFNKTMVPLAALPEGDGSGPLTIEPAIQGKYRWMGTNTLVFIPSDTLTLATRYTVTIPADTKALSGERLRKPYQWSFETARPQFMKSNIYDQARGVTLSPKIYLLFNQKISLASAKESIQLSDNSANYPRVIRIAQGDSADIKSYFERFSSYSDYYDEDFSNGAKRDVLGRLLVVEPEEKLALQTDYTVWIYRDLKGVFGALGSAETQAIHFTTYGPLDMSDNVNYPLFPNSPIMIKLTNSVEAEEIKNHTTIAPYAELTDVYETSWSGDYSHQLYFAFKPQTSYTITFDQDMKDIFGNTLGRTVIKSFTTGDYESRVEFEGGEHIIESYLSHDFNISVINPGNVDVRMAKLSQQTLINAVRHNAAVNWSVFHSDIPPTEKNYQQNVPIRLDEALGTEKSGAVLVEIKHAPWSDFRRTIVQITDIGITAKYSRLNNLIYLTSLKDGHPIAQGYVEVRDDNGILKWHGFTDEKGFAQTPGWQALGITSENEWSSPTQWIFAAKGDQRAYTYSGMRVAMYRFNIPISWKVPSDHAVSGYLFTNQGIYRPGDNVLIKGLTRQLAGEAWTTEPAEVKIIIKNPSYEDIFSKAMRTNDLGSFDFEYPVSADAKLGYYTVKAFAGTEEIASESFQVQEFKPVESEVSVTTAKNEYVWKEKLDAVLDGHYLFGAPLSNTDIRWNITRTKSSFVPDGYDDYFFGALWDDDYRPSGSRYASAIQSKTEKLNERGLLSVSLPLQNDGYAETSNLVIEGTVQDKNRQEVSGRKSVVVHAGKFYIGLKPATTFHSLGEPLALGVIAVTPQGEKLGGKRITIEWIHREWISVREKMSDGGFQWNSQIKDSLEMRLTLVSDKQEASAELHPQGTGYYILRASAEDDLGNKIFSSCYVYVVGDATTGWRLNNDDAVDLVPNKVNYNPGETAKILVKSPYTQCRAMVTVEREGIFSHFAADLNGNASVIEIPVTADLIPNAFVSVILLQGRTALPTEKQLEDLGKPGFKIGYAQLSVNADENKLAVTIKTKKEKFSPNDWVSVDLQVKDHQGKGIPSEVTLFVEDVGVLNLINYKTPDPFTHFYKHRELAVSTSESRQYILDQVVQKDLKEKGGIGGGGGDDYFPAIAVRKNFKACVFWDPSIQTDANGRANIKFQLPENLTGFKILAVAHTADSKFGNGQKNITVSKSLMLRPALPRFARVGDAVEAGVIVHNYSDRDGAVKIRAEVDGAIITDPPVQEIALKKGQSQEVRYRFTITENKTGVFTFKAAMNDLTDGVEIRIPLKIPSYTETVALYGSSTDRHSEEVVVPKEIYEDYGGLEVTTSSTALVDLDGSVKYLFEYPYGCLEQKTSRALPIILFGDVVKAFRIHAFPDGNNSMEEVIQTYLNDVPKYQNFSGGFSYWTGGEYVSPYVSVYAMLALTKAKEKGYHINSECFDKGLAYLKTIVRNNSIDRFGLMYWHATRALALSVLADNNYYDASAAELLFQRREELPLFARAMLWKAIVKGHGYALMADELRRDLSNAIKMSPTSAHFEEPSSSGLEWTFHSTMRTTAAVLQTFLELDREQVPWAEKVVKYILQERKIGRWRTTQENTYVFWALGTYFQIFEKETPDFSSRVLIDGKEILNEIYRGRTVDTRTARVGLGALRKETKLPLEFNKTGDGRMYYTARMTYAPKSNVVIKPRDEGIRILKTLEDENGHAVTNGKFKAGAWYKIKLTVSSAQDRNFLVVDDPLPAGFEAVNVNLATSGAAAKQAVSHSYRSWWSYGDFDNSELRDDRVVIFADWFSKGTHTFSYLARATTYGTFELPVTKAEEMYAPEVFGTTGNQTVIVE